MKREQAEFPFYRSQVDAKAAHDAKVSSQISCDPKENMVRPEFQKAVSTDELLKKYVAAPWPAAGVVDFDLDLQRSFEVIESTRNAWMDLPESVRAKYSSWDEVFEAARSGELKDVIAPPVSGGDVAASASDSAPVPPAEGV